jgi:diguanylate cyclase (GGDEF)-like protein/PAS domain S-box-containing protein
VRALPLAGLRQILPTGRSLPEEAWRGRHHALLAVLWLHVVGVPIFGLTQGFELEHAAVDALVLFLFATLASLSTAAGWSRKASSACVSLGLLTSSALFVHFWDGTVEGHFHFFVMIALLLLYEEWLPFLVAIGFVLVHHGVMGQLDPASVYAHRAAVAHPWKWAAIHAVFVAGAAAANIVAWRLNENIRSSLSRAQRRVEEREQQFRTLVANLPGAVYRRSAHGDERLALLSEKVDRIVGYDASEFLEGKRSLASLVHPDDVGKVEAAVDRALHDSSPYVVEYRLLHADGSVRWIWERGQPDVGRDGVWLDGVFFDITDRKEAEEALARQAELNEHLALHDGLTGLPNRTLFRDRIEQATAAHARAGRDFAVLVLDLDRFKEINDTLGHHMGDILLEELGRRLERTVRSADTVARLGGDEFGILLDGCDSELVAQLVDRVHAVLDEQFVLHGLPLTVEASVGVAFFPEHGDDVDVLLQRADIAMYHAKAAGLPYAQYDPDEDDYNPRRLILLGELRNAIDRKELVLHYQPKANLRTAQVGSVEALVRWQHAGLGLVPPDEFIPLAQETGLIKPLTLYVIDEALRQCRAWLDDGQALRVAVNLSTRNLIDDDFPSDVARLLAAHEVGPELLELEVTESAILANPLLAGSVMQRLSDMGIRLSIDDFGTGYSSLAYLTRLPVDEIKIDRSFVMDMITDEDNLVIVRSTVDLGRNLGLVVVAEGVETLAIWDELKRLGCDEAQGYFLSRPLPAEELSRWLEASRLELVGYEVDEFPQARSA